VLCHAKVSCASARRKSKTGSSYRRRFPLPAVLRPNLISQYDLEEDLRLDAETEDLSDIRVARIERSGDISLIKAEK
jgi:hypothetical protein